MQRIIGKRSKGIWNEFVTKAWLMTQRLPSTSQTPKVWQGKWQDSISRFLDTTNDAKPRGVYIDPPYSRVQYSRYYHVFDTMLRYDYPICIGKGRYPPVATRFTSRFDSRPASVQSEFIDLFAKTSSAGLTTFVSYADQMSIPLSEILDLMRDAFSDVSLYTRALRHRSQGQPMRDRGMRTEVVLVGRSEQE